MKALIFGVGGQDGHFLSALLRQRQIEVFGVSRSGGQARGDIGDYAFIETLIRAQRPDFIFHFAANSSTRHETLFDNHTAIATGTLNVLESARLHAPRARIFLSGSAMQFKNQGLPISEQTAFEASSPYSIARIQSVYAARYYRSTFGMAVYVGYFFNHDSPLRSDRHVNQKVAAAAKRIAAGSGEKLQLGSIDVRKEFNYAGDVVEAAWLLVNQERVFEAVIGSGLAYSIRQWTDYCFRSTGRDWQAYVEVSSGYVPEYSVLVSNPALMKSLGWNPRVDFQALADLMMATP